MNAVKQKIVRATRLYEIDVSKLDALVNELAEIDAKIANIKDVVERIEICLSGVGGSIDSATVTSQRQAIAYANHLQESLHTAHSALYRREAERDEHVTQMVQQRATVRGWELLLEKLKKQSAIEQERIDNASADEQHLRQTMRKIR